jgi:nucleoside-diphosphate-sugar epimerase
MQTIFRANGQIDVELARELRRASRNPRKVNDTDKLVSANLLDARQAADAVKGSSVVYFTAGLPADTQLWETQFPVMLKNALDACRAEGASFAYFDNIYMYPQDARLQTEEMPFAPVGRKGKGRAAMTCTVLEEMERGDIPVLIGRAPEFYGPRKTQSFTNALVIDRLRKGKKPLVPVQDDTRRTLVWTPDASRAPATLGNAPDAFGQTWHLPCCDDRLTYKEFMTMASTTRGKPVSSRRFGEHVDPIPNFNGFGIQETHDILESH